MITIITNKVARLEKISKYIGLSNITVVTFRERN